ncbi:HNH endonuclease [Sphingomonas sp. IC-11]|uniref:HNH endonuclease n=1 Tax=Sphingomonas sp. IC-11 TaxID=2898528 RepID=UPI001E28368B|nr:HNH endonuclease [Sphingomonas sp. IC-11]MCD2316379.1 HNH endonuclease [Sphingomonas sp. IC-11]
MDKAIRNPVWSRDELILALDLYVQTGGNPTGKDDEAVEQLSVVLNKMHRLNGGGGSDTLRNRNGVYLKVMNFRSSDPAYLQQGKVGMTRGNRLEAVLWKEYEGRSADLAADAAAIREAVANADEAVVAKLPAAEPYEGEEGGVIMRLHKRYERDPKLVKEKRNAAAAAGSLACEVCNFDFEAAYGELGAGYVEVHHTKPVHTLHRRTRTKLSDLAVLCANCHRMAHRKRIPLDLEAVRLALRFRR